MTVRTFPRGLGQTRQTVGQATEVGGSLAAAGVSVAGATGAIAAGTAALAATGIGAAVALVALIVEFIGKGCGNACILSAKAEQIYEAAADDLYAVAKLGMLSKSDYETGIQTILQGGQQHLQQLQASGDAKAAGGLTNMNKVIQAELADGANLPATASKPIDLTKAQLAFASAGTQGWYSDSVAAGNQLALTYLQSLASQQASQTSVVAASPGTGTVAILGKSFSTGEVLVALAVLAGVIYLVH